jgi:hypothetical protein
MDVSNILYNVKQLGPEFLNSYCIINRKFFKLEDLEKMGCNEFAAQSKATMPTYLYRYFPDVEKFDTNSQKNINYSIQALKNNTVFLQSPTEFDDVYDSDIAISFPEYEHLSLIDYCHRCGIEVDEDEDVQTLGNKLTEKLYEFFIASKPIKDAFIFSESKEEKLANELLELRIANHMIKTHDFGVSVSNALLDEYNEYNSKLKRIFRTVCFTTTPYSQLMWGGMYANCHKGFCIEYRIIPDDEKYKDVFYNLYPLIYCKRRPNMTRRLVEAKDKPFTIETLWDLYSHGVLRKSIDWAFQDEWRLVLPRNFYGDNSNVEFFPISKVYLGNRMSPERRKEIINICHEKNIPYVGVKRSENIFEMKDCEVLCEDCPNYKNA